MRWNNVWLADRGYAVLNYTARGHEGSEGSIQLASKRLRGARHALSDRPARGRFRPAHRPAPRGGGRRLLRRRAGLAAAHDPRGHRAPIRRVAQPGPGASSALAAAVPQYTWSDLLYALAPSGHHLSSGARPGDAPRRPSASGKLTLVNGFLATIGGRITPQIASWLGRVRRRRALRRGPGGRRGQAPVRARAARPSTRTASSAPLRARRQRRVPVLVAQGWTDPIFPAIEALRMYRRLKAADPALPGRPVPGRLRTPDGARQGSRPRVRARPRRTACSTATSVAT